jgi:hypothetical protein
MEGWIMADIKASSFGKIPSGNTSSRPSSPVIGDTYYNGTLELLEIYNGTQWVPSSAPPAAPTVTSVTDVGTGLAYATGGTFTVVVSPNANGSTPVQYNVLVPNTSFSATSSSTTISLTGLTSNTSFQIAAQANNNFGTSVNSTLYSAVTATTVPQAPIIGTASTSNTTTDVTVTWTLGNNGGKNLSSITVTPYLNGTTAGSTQNAATTSATSMTFTGLTMGSSYTFKVKATNTNGTSLESSATNSVTIPTLIQVDYLVIAGGGAGGTRHGGGGGAGGYRNSVSGETSGRGSSAESFINAGVSTNYTVTVGAGGATNGSNYAGVAGNPGSNSVFATITSLGGGRGTAQPLGGNGGSGGGAGFGAGGTGTAGQGYDAGNYIDNGSYPGGGGGGAGGAGGNTSGGTGGAGGLGLASSITGTSVTRASGGAGGSFTSSGGSASTGGGGNGAGNGSGNAGAGTANTGGGGGGGGGDNPNIAGAGGSGVVILRYPSANTITIGAGLTGTTATTGSYKVTTITAGTGNVSWE